MAMAVQRCMDEGGTGQYLVKMMDTMSHINYCK
jgi:hypothetical protein